MKTLRSLSALLSMLPALASCDLLGLDIASHEGEISIFFDKDSYSSVQTKASSSSDIPDTNKFILTVTKSSGETVYSGDYGAAPLTILTSPGKYVVTVSSSSFKAPAWSTPVYGDSQDVTVSASKTALVTLLCHQTNAGVRLNVDKAFLTAYPSGSLLLKSTDGKLLYSYSEKRYAYFAAGAVSLVLSNGSTDTELLKRTLSSGEMLTINIKVNSSSSSSTQSSPLSIAIDTARNWTSCDYTLGSSSGSGKGSDKSSAYSVSEARSNVGKDGVWVYGYIVGGDLSSSKASFKAPFSSRTNIVLAAKSSVTDKSVCLSVQLEKGDIRDELNLVDHPDNLGRQVYLKGDIVSAYYGIPGIQNLEEYELK